LLPSYAVVSARTRYTRLARWSLILAALFMGFALLATVWTTNRGVRDASVMLVRGQSTVLHENIRSRMAADGKAPVDADVDAILAELSPDGLRWLAILDENGAVRRQAGAPSTEASPAALLAMQPGVPVELAGRARVVFRRPVRPPTAETSARPRGTPIAVEFEPKPARELQAAGRYTLTLGALAAGVFLAIAVWLVRWFLRRERLERQLDEERRLAGLGRMSAVLAHEIRNPLASLKGNAQLLARALPDGERLRAKADLLVDEAVRLEMLSNDLLEFARAGELQLKDVDPRALAREAAATVDGERVSVVAEDAPASWRLDPSRMRQVLTNLIENAAQASDGAVTAKVGRDRGELIFEVRDLGPGIKDEDLPRLFEPFFTKRIRGTGLGLAICKRLVDLHGGTLSAGNAEGGGAVFTVRIPREVA
jgi:two-component system sensor histidine kinase HydH